MLSAINHAVQLNAIYSLDPRQASVAQGVQTSLQSVGNQRIAESGAVKSDNARPISYSPSISGDRSTRVSNSNDPAEETNSRQSFQQKAQEFEVEQVIRQLEARDAEVRAHEMAHLAAAGQYARGLSYTYQTGPDGKQYAIGGEVGIDTSEVPNDPQATIDKAMVIQRAALAPAEPSAQDRRVAQAATQMMAEARFELAEQQRVESESAKQRLGISGSSDSLDNRTDSQPTQIPSPENSISQSLSHDRQQFDLRLQISAA